MVAVRRGGKRALASGDVGRDLRASDGSWLKGPLAAIAASFDEERTDGC
jgi:hypothetical protein